MKNVRLITTLGPLVAESQGMILPHEHVFVDLGPIEASSHLSAEAEPVIALMVPEIEKLQAQGFTALVECTPSGIGRRADIVRAVSEAAGFPIVVPTGVYREPGLGASGRRGGDPGLDAGRVDRPDRRQRRPGRLDQAECRR